MLAIRRSRLAHQPCEAQLAINIAAWGILEKLLQEEKILLAGHCVFVRKNVAKPFRKLIQTAILAFLEALDRTKLRIPGHTIFHCCGERPWVLQEWIDESLLDLGDH